MRDTSLLEMIRDRPQEISLEDLPLIYKHTSVVSRNGKASNVTDLYFESLAPESVVNSVIMGCGIPGIDAKKDMTYETLSKRQTAAVLQLLQRTPLVAWVHLNEAAGLARGGIDTVLFMCQDDYPLLAAPVLEVPKFTQEVLEAIGYSPIGSYRASDTAIQFACLEPRRPDFRLEVLPYGRLPEMIRQISTHIEKTYCPGKS